MKNLILGLALSLLASSAFAERYNRNGVLSYIESTGTTHEPLIQVQTLGCGMAAYDALEQTDLIVQQNKTIIEQNNKIIALLKKR